MFINDFDFISNLFNKQNNVGRLGKLFRTDQYGYFYDTGTGKVVQCEDEEYRMLEWFFKGNTTSNINNFKFVFKLNTYEILHSLRETLENENLLQVEVFTEFFSPQHKEYLKKFTDSSSLITLELTEKCNLRCSYCIYNESYSENRNFSSKEMSQDVVKASIDYILKHGKDQISITFYGGEPLLKFDLIKWTVNYVNKNIGSKKVSFSMTSNLTLMNKQMADFFASIKHFSIVCSLDGPEHLHNQYRRYLDNSGSFCDTLRGLRYVVESYQEKATDLVSVSMVFTPPYTYKKIDEIQDFFRKTTWLSDKIDKLISYPENGSITYKGEDFDGKEICEENSNHIFYNPLLSWAETKKINSSEDYLFTDKFLQEMLLKIHYRPLFDKPFGLLGMNGCCVPSNMRLYITTEGEFKPCERMGNCPSIGNVFTGLNHDKIIKKYVIEYEKKSILKCSNCWASRICSVCYAKLYDNEGLDINKKDNICEDARHSAYKSLILYHKMLEHNPVKLELLNNIQLY